MSLTHKYIVVLTIVVIFIAAGIAFFVINKKSNTNNISSPDIHPFPNLALKDADGNNVEVSSLRGRPVVLDAWASWCLLCTKHISYFVEIQKEFGDKLIVIEVNRGEPLEVVKKYIDQSGFGRDVTFLFDESDSFYKAIDGFLMPETVFIDKDGVMRDHTRGSLDIIEMRRRIQDSFAL